MGKMSLLMSSAPRNCCSRSMLVGSARASAIGRGRYPRIALTSRIAVPDEFGEAATGTAVHLTRQPGVGQQGIRMREGLGVPI